MSRLICLLIALLVSSQQAAAQALKVENHTTILAVWIDAAGKVKRAEVRKSCGRVGCDSAALAAVIGLEFVPATDVSTRENPKLLEVNSNAEVKELPP